MILVEQMLCLKKSVDDAFDKYNLNGEKYIKCMISGCADGASVNMGKHNEVLTIMKNERNWLLIIHCSSHRLELAVKDAFQEIEDFQRLDDMMLKMHLPMGPCHLGQEENGELNSSHSNDVINH